MDSLTTVTTVTFQGVIVDKAQELEQESNEQVESRWRELAGKVFTWIIDGLVASVEANRSGYGGYRDCPAPFRRYGGRC